MKRNASNNGIKQFLPDLLISLASSFLLIYVPVQVYIANELDFSFDVYDVLHYSPLFALVVFLLLMGILALTHYLGEMAKKGSYAFAVITGWLKDFYYFTTNDFVPGIKNAFMGMYNNLADIPI